MVHSTTGLIHLIAAMAALLTGLVVFLRPKGTMLHRVLGYAYCTSMAVMLFTALTIYRLTQSANLLHVFALVSFVPLVLGLLAAMKRKPGWMESHYEWMCWSNIGLWAALVAETSTRVALPFVIKHFEAPSMALFWSVVMAASTGVVGVGAVLVKRNKPLVIRLTDAGGEV